MKPKVSIIIPCYNEEENLKRGVLEGIEQYLKAQNFSYEVIISDDGSTDKSQEIVNDFIAKQQTSFIKKAMGFKLLKNPHGGKPFAIRAGVEDAKGEISLFTDMDQSTPISELEKFLPFFDKGYQMVIGSRGKERKEFPGFRKVLSWGFRNLRRAILLRGLIDTQCGFKAFKSEAGRHVFSKMQMFKKEEKRAGWKVGAWDVEFLFVAEKLGYKIKEVPVSWEDRDVAAGKERNFLKESKEMLLEIVKVKINDWRGKYDR